MFDQTFSLLDDVSIVRLRRFWDSEKKREKKKNSISKVLCDVGGK